MSYGVAAALQSAVFQHLEASPAIQAQIGAAIYDSAPPGNVPGTYVVLGPEEARDRSDGTHDGAIHDFVVSVVTNSAGFHAAKAVAAAISDELVGAALALNRGRLVNLHFVRARAERSAKGTQRRIDLRFRALVEDA